MARSSIPSRTTPSGTTTWTFRSTCREYSSFAQPTSLTLFQVFGDFEEVDLVQGYRNRTCRHVTLGFTMAESGCPSALPIAQLLSDVHTAACTSILLP
eukprot:534417-Amphidinium_carterae.1